MLDAVGGRLLVDVVEVKALRGGIVLAEGGSLGQAGEGILAGDADEGDGSGDEAVDGFGGEVGGTGAGGALCGSGGDEDAEADGAGAGFFESFDVAETDLGGEFVALVDDGLGVGRSGFEGSGEDVGGELLQVGGGDDVGWNGGPPGTTCGAVGGGTPSPFP